MGLQMRCKTTGLLAQDCDHCKQALTSAASPVTTAAAGSPSDLRKDDRNPKVCPRCGNWCVYDGWDHVHGSGVGIGSCTPDAAQEAVERVEALVADGERTEAETAAEGDPVTVMIRTRSLRRALNGGDS